VKFLRSLIPFLVQEVRFADSDGVHRTPEIGGVRGWSNKHSVDRQFPNASEGRFKNRPQGREAAERS